MKFFNEAFTTGQICRVAKTQVGGNISIERRESPSCRPEVASARTAIRRRSFFERKRRISIGARSADADRRRASDNRSGAYAAPPSSAISRSTTRTNRLRSDVHRSTLHMNQPAPAADRRLGPASQVLPRVDGRRDNASLRSTSTNRTQTNKTHPRARVVAR